MSKITRNISVAVFLFLFMATKITFAQEDERVLNIGLKAGLNYSWLNIEDAEDETGKIGFHGGLVARINLSNYIALQGEALYSTKGSRVEYDNLLFDGEAKLYLDYIDVPVLLVFKLNENINIHAGPYFGFLVNAKAKNDSSVDLFDFEDEVDRDYFTSTDIGISGGLGFQVQRVIGGLRYNHGLKTIDEDAEVDGTLVRFEDARNSNVQLYIGFLF